MVGVVVVVGVGVGVGVVEMIWIILSIAAYIVIAMVAIGFLMEVDDGGGRTHYAILGGGFWPLTSALMFGMALAREAKKRKENRP